jgi:hypothetical protein
MHFSLFSWVTSRRTKGAANRHTGSQERDTEKWKLHLEGGSSVPEARGLQYVKQVIIMCRPWRRADAGWNQPSTEDTQA